MIDIFDKVFCLSDGKFTYALAVEKGSLINTYFGKAIPVTDSTVAQSAVSFGLGATERGQELVYEFGTRGCGDFRIPAFACESRAGMCCRFTYAGYKLLDRKPALDMPSLRNGGQTLVITLEDAISQLELYLYYTVYDGAIVRRSVVKNVGRSDVKVSALASATLNFPTGRYDLIDLNGRWGGECNVCRAQATCGIKSFGSVRGVSSHQHNPFLAIAEPSATEESGEVYAVNLVYSGNFSIDSEVDERQSLRVNCGFDIRPGITLHAGQSLSSPEAVIVYSDCGLGGMSRLFHRLYRKNLIDPRFADKPRPIVLNSWEAFYFDIGEKKMTEFIDAAGGLGFDVVVLDDGWFGRRDDDRSSLGDWFVDKTKFPNGLEPVIAACKRNGMKFGIWFEPEAVNPVSKMFEQDPDCAIGVNGRERVQMRNQYLLDFSDPAIVDNIFAKMCAVLDEYDITYVKWDMNRAITDMTDAEQTLGYVKGVYSLYERLTKKYPYILIEGCSSGGGRFDPAILYYSPLIWTSDNTDAYARAHIQYGASYCYPLQTLSNHVSACPCAQTGRVTPLGTRGAVASLGCLGCELDVNELTDVEREQVKSMIARYRADCELIINGDLYRLVDPFETGRFCELVVSEDRSRAYYVYVRGDNYCNCPLPRVKLRGLDPAALYAVTERGVTVTGADLMYRGIDPDAYGSDFCCEVLHIETVK